MRHATCLLLLLVAFPGPADAKEAAKNLLGEASFERLVAGKVPKAGTNGSWKLGGDKTLPAGWSLNAAYPGTLTVGSQPEQDGAHAIHLAAGAKNDAQIFRPCAAIRPGRWYRVSMRVRGGTATLLTYEYDRDGATRASILGSVQASASEWRTVTGFYTPQSETFMSTSVALLAPRQKAAWIDDVRVTEMQGPVAARGARTIKLKTKSFELEISGAGRLTSLVIEGSKANHAANAPMLTATLQGVTMPVATLAKKGSTLIARFPDSMITVKLRAKAQGNHLLFEVVSVKPKALEAFSLRFPVLPAGVRDMWMPGTYDGTRGLTHMAVSPNTKTRLVHHGKHVALEARWFGKPGFRGGRSAFLATSGKAFLPAIRKLELATGLPSPTLRSDVGASTATQDWARLSPALKKSYLFATHLGFGDIDALIEHAQLGGFGLIMLHRKAWRASAGHETIAPTAFPEGLSTLTAVCERIHAAGLGVGLHLYGPAVSTNDAYVTPVPDKRLYSHAVGRLGATLSADATELLLAEAPALPQRGAADVYPGNLLRIGDELIRWQRMIPGSPTRITGCERGACHTVAKTHRSKTQVRTLVMRNGGLLVDPDSSLPAELGAHLGRVVNATQADLVYFDGNAAAAPTHEPKNWYYLNKVLLASCATFDHGVLVQAGTGPGRQLPWHLIPRSASADGHGDLKHYLDRRTAGILQMRRTHVAADLGWYALDIHGRPDELEYVCAKALALDASISVQAYKALLDVHPRAREVFEMIARWERRRLAGDVPTDLRALLRTKQRDVRLLEAEDGWSLWEAQYEVDRPIATLDGKANRWSVTNARKTPVTLGLEIVRVAIAATPADHAASNAVAIDPLSAPTGFKFRGAAALAKAILLGGRGRTALGFSRRGVTTTLTAVTDAAVGGKALIVKAVSSIGGAGWGSTGKTFAKPLDLSKAKSLGLWVHGDGRGASLVVTLVDANGVRSRHATALDYTGWRFQSFVRKGPKAMDWRQVAHLVLELAHMPPRSTVIARVAALRAMPGLHKPQPMPGVTVHVGRRAVDLNVALEPGRCITIDALGRGVSWPGGMRAGSMAMIAGGPLLLAPGTTTVGVSLADPSGYAGDLRMRVCRMWPLGE